MTTRDVWQSIQPKLNEEILKCLNQHFNFPTMMPVQKAAIPLFLKHYDVAVEAQTGSGKTLSFLIPIFNNILIKYKQMKKNQEQKQQDLFSIIIVPTRELATQISDVAQIFSSNLKEQFIVQLCIGGYPIEKDLAKIQDQGCNILIGSPGKLRELFDRGQLKSYIKVNNLEYLIFDEADRLIKNEYWSDIQVILDQLPKQRRTGIFSATLNQANSDFAKLGLRNPVKIQIKADIDNVNEQDNKIDMPKSLKNYYYFTKDRTEKLSFLYNYLMSRLDEKLKIILFFNTCATAEYYNHIFKLTELGQQINIQCMHGQQKQKKRNNVYNQFKQYDTKKTSVLITTNVVARGIDFNDVQLVIQFDPPQDPSFFVHRVGRTARSGREGEAIIILEENEKKFVKFLKTKDIQLTEIDLINYNQILDFQQIQNQIHQFIIQDRDLVEKGKQAFVSFIRSYKEHKLQLIFNLNELDIGQVAYSFFLLRLPRVKEILGKKIEFVQSDINPFDIEFVDKNKEKQFNEKKQKKNEIKQSKNQVADQPKKIQFHNQYMGKEINVKNNKSLRKKVKTNNDEQDFNDMQEELRLVKKFKKRLITKEQFNEKMKKFDPFELQSDLSD